MTGPAALRDAVRDGDRPPAAEPGSGRPVARWRGGVYVAADPPAPAPEEAAVAVVIDGSSQAVLMATPHDLDDFALGFALTEGLIDGPGDVDSAEAVEVEAPIPGRAAWEARLWLRPGLSVRLADRRRSMVGPVGCELCGVDSIAAALPAVTRVVADTRLAPAQVGAAMTALSQGQRRWRETPAIHAAALWTPDGALVREDVGRHNALDKLAGAVARGGADAGQGAVAMTSRLSVDLVQKTVRLGAPVLIGAGVPTRLAIAWAEAAGLTLIGRAREGGFDVFTHPHRLEP